MSSALRRTAAAAIVAVLASFSAGETGLASGIRHNTWTAGLARLPIDSAIPYDFSGQAAAGGAGLIYYAYSTGHLWAYSPALNTWTRKASFPGTFGPTLVFAATTGTLYLLGESNQQLEAYSVATDTWTAAPSSPVPGLQQFSAAMGPDGRLYVAGGEVGGITTNRVDVFDPTTKTWSAVAPMLTPMLAPLVRGSDGDLYSIAGGQSERYNLHTNTWQSVAGVPVPPGAGCTVLGGDGRIYTLGLTSHGKTGMAAYSSLTGAWTIVASLPHYEAGESCASLPGSQFWVMGGIAGGIHEGTYRYNI